MRASIPAIGIVAVMCMLSISPADACGDKSLRIGRGARYQRTTRPAAVLIYAPRSARDTAARTLTLRSVAEDLKELLTLKGHSYRKTQDTDGLAEALNSKRYDVVLTDLAGAEDLQKAVDASLSKPVVVPVASNETKAQVTTAKKQYRFIVKDPTSGDQYLDAIEDAMRSRTRVLAGNR